MVVLSFVVGLIPDLLINGLNDLWGVCGFDSTICNDIKLQGSVQLVASILCAFVAVVVALVLSKEYNSKGNDSGIISDSKSKGDERS